MSETYKPSGCAVVFGVVSIIFGVVLLFTTFPVGLIPAAAFIGGGFRLLTGVGNL